MNIVKKTLRKSLFCCLVSALLFGCKDEQVSENKADVSQSVSSVTQATSPPQTASASPLQTETPLAYVKRSLSQQESHVNNSYTSKLNDAALSPVEVMATYDFYPGAKLLVRSGLNVNASEEDILSSYFGAEEYDVKDLNVSPDGRLLVFAARGSQASFTNPTWNIFSYDFIDRNLTRVIADDVVANRGHDTNPVVTWDNQILFSSDRSQKNFEDNALEDQPDNQICRIINSSENPSLLHSMTTQGSNVLQLTFGRYNHDVNLSVLQDGRIAFVRWEPSFESASSCAALPAQNSSSTANANFPRGLALPDTWSQESKCAQSRLTPNGQVFVTNHYKVLTISADGQSMQQLYDTTTASSSDEAFLAIDQIFQAESGNLFSLLRHQYNPVQGGALLELPPVNQVKSNSVFAQLSPQFVSTESSDLYPEQLSENGWFSSFWPYRDGTSRLLVSWAQCTLTSNGVTSFCDSANNEGDLTARYGIWALDPVSNTKSPIVRAEADALYTDLVLAQVHQTNDLSLTPFNSNFVDNDYVSDIECVEFNRVPVAEAGASTNGYLGDTFSLDASNSSDPDGDTLTYHWTVLSKPSNSVAGFDNANVSQTNFSPDLVGDYLIELIVNDGEYDSEPDTLVISVELGNQIPLANAGDAQMVIVGSSVSLDGTNSSDPDGDDLTYQWSFVSQPPLSNISLSGATTSTPQFVTQQLGEYVVQLVVNDGTANSVADDVTISVVEPPNTAPIADAGNDQVAEISSQVILNGAGSFDAEGDPLNYYWSLVSQPQGSNVQLLNSNQVAASFISDIAGIYTVQLYVNDGRLDSNLDTVSIELIDSNEKPVADAGVDQVADVSIPVTLDGSGSYDPDGDTLTYYWSLVSQPADSNAELVNSNQVAANFIGDTVGSYVFQLYVNDGEFDSNIDTVLVELIKKNERPVANAGDDQADLQGNSVNLDGTNSYDPENDPLSYHWTVGAKPEGAIVTIDNADQANASFSGDIAGTYVVYLVVNDGQLDSDADTAVIELSSVEMCNLSDDTNRSLPIVIRDFEAMHPDFEYKVSWDAGIVASQLGTDGLPVYANPAGTTITTNGQNYFDQWYRDIAGVNINIAKTISLSREAGTTKWEYQNDEFFPIDGEGWGNTEHNSYEHNYHFTLEAHLSFDYKGGEVFTFRGDDDLWLFINGQLAIDLGGVHAVGESTINIDDVAAALGLSPGNRYSFDLFFAERHTVASNFMFQTDIDLECGTPNRAPVADAGNDQTVSVDEIVVLDGSASSDIDGDSVTYQWLILEQPTDSTASLNDSSAVMPNFVIDQLGTYVIQLIVNDGIVDSVADTVTLDVSNSRPIADAGEDLFGVQGEQLHLDGSASSDIDGDSISYQWLILSKPEGSISNLEQADSVSPNIALDQHGIYTLQLIVSDGLADSEPDIMTINTLNTRPVANSGPDQSGTVGAVVELDGSASYDADGDALNFHWSIVSQPEESNAFISDSDSVNASITPQCDGIYIMQLVVNDGNQDSEPDTIVINTSNARPVADAGQDQVVATEQIVMLDGSASFDPDQDELSYQWNLISQPQGSSAALSDANSIVPQMTADLPGDYVVQLVVNDGLINSLPDTVVFTTQQPINCGAATAFPDTLWSPNHKFEEIQIEGLDESTQVRFSQITQDEPLGKFNPDAWIDLAQDQGSDRLFLRSEREGNLLNGRVYKVHFDASNNQGESCSGSVEVVVPHDQSHPVVDDGQNYISTGD